MALREVLCSLLLDGPAHGYQLQATLEAELGPLWVTRASQVYLTLGRMQRDGLVVSRRVRQAARPDRQLLRLTERGRAVATDWLFAPGPAEEIVVRLALARLVLPDRFAELATLILEERTRAPRARVAMAPGRPGHRAGDDEPTPALRLEAVSRSFASGAAEVRAVRAVTMAVPAGTAIAVTG